MCVCLRASTPIVEDYQDVGESNASVVINIGGARVFFSFFDAKVGHAKSDVINVVISIAVKVTKHVCFCDTASTIARISFVRIFRAEVLIVTGAISVGVLTGFKRQGALELRKVDVLIKAWSKCECS